MLPPCLLRSQPSKLKCNIGQDSISVSVITTRFANDYGCDHHNQRCHQTPVGMFLCHLASADLRRHLSRNRTRRNHSIVLFTSLKLVRVFGFHAIHAPDVISIPFVACIARSPATCFARTHSRNIDLVLAPDPLLSISFSPACCGSHRLILI